MLVALGVDLHVDVRIGADIVGMVRADLEHHGRTVRPVDQVVAVGFARLEAGAVARAQHLFARIGDQHHLALDHEDELFVVAVPVSLAGPGARLDDGVIDPELGQAGGAPDLIAHLVHAGSIEGHRIARTAAGLARLDVDLLHAVPRFAPPVARA